jgi:signal transduction histidine kinase
MSKYNPINNSKSLSHRSNWIRSKVFKAKTYDGLSILKQLGELIVGYTQDCCPIDEDIADLITNVMGLKSCGFVWFRDDIQAEEYVQLIGSKPTVLGSEHKTQLDKLHHGYNSAEVVALLKFDNQRLGLMILGHKTSGYKFSAKDLDIIATVANLISPIFVQYSRLALSEANNKKLSSVSIANNLSLRQSNQKLKALDEAKDEFVSMASHQLRTPLTSIKGYLSMVIEGDAGDISPLQADMLNQAYASSQRMVFLIADLLNVSRLKTGKFVIESKTTKLAELVSTEVAQLQETAKSRKLSLSYLEPKDFPDMQLDETKIRQVVMNFIDNAIYYTPQGGKITVTLEKKTKSIELKVDDNGMGVPKSSQHQLFTKFYRADNAQKARPDGTGIGLFMAKKVIVAQGGSIIFKSQEGQGSTFGFTFPLQ